ncbi:helix-turn-helix domain-containing protein [Amphritea pacifica]|uniref:AlbA family DNA-binding domain-containing protein n=1 Tax=Amphritea pacifica TaxID=2811233 RepID=UPI0019637494|nr:ATP-binding protein [Amphritea pacifica]MBN1006831.1 putative DNA binding domain-containing protein [Amphritea pacifica]
MPVKREYQQISQRARSLLAKPEGVDVDFKREINGIKSRDLVSFSNSSQGGAILVGVDEYTNKAGLQRGRVVGCDVDDSARLSLINKATDCYPIVDIELVVENISNKPFFRIEIPPGGKRPYCTQRGEYAIRADARSRALYPEELLAMFMDREGELFLTRFREAVAQLEQRLGQMDHAFGSGMEQLVIHLDELDSQVRRTLTRVDQMTDSAKKRSRNMLQALRDSQDSIAGLEALLVAQNGNPSGRLEIMRDIRTRLDQLTENLNPGDGQSE